MLRIINFINDDVSQTLEHNIKTSFHPGKFVSLIKGKIEISDGFNIFGVIDDIKDKNFFGQSVDTTAGSKRVTVWTQRLVMQTDMIEQDSLQYFKKYHEIYVRKGRITPEKWHAHLKPAGLLLDIVNNDRDAIILKY